MITINSDYANYIDNGSIGMENIRTEDIFVVDTSSRAIIVPESWTAVGALQDHFAEKIWFSVDRFFDDKDFATAQKFMINFLNAANEGFAHNSTEVYLWDPLTNALLDITSGYTPDPTDYGTYTKILFCWKISQNVTIRTGKVTFAIRLGAFTFSEEESGANNQWIWSSGLATLNVIETVSAENGLDDDNNEWSVSDLSRWFESLAKIGNSFNTYLDVIDTDYKVFYGSANGGEQKYIKYDSSSQMLTTATTAYAAYDPDEAADKGPYRDLNNAFYRIDNRGFISTATRDVKYGLWINSDETGESLASLPQITTATTSTTDCFSAKYVSTTFLTQADAGNTYLTTAAANSDYLKKADAANTYETTSHAAATYETSAHAASSYLGTTAIVDSNASTATNSTWSSKAIKDAIDSNALPTVTSADNGYVLMVVNGAWGLGQVSGGSLIPVVVQSSIDNISAQGEIDT